MNVQIVKEYPSPFGSDNVVLMRGYSKPSSTSAISSSDSLNTAIGKLEKAIESGGGSSDPYDGRKIRYTISSSNWSSSPNSDGYYTYSLTLTNPLSTSTSPNVYIAGSTDNTEPTATEKTMFGYVKRCNLSSTTTLVLYASTKPTSTFYVFVGAEGGGGETPVDISSLLNTSASQVGTITISYAYRVGKVCYVWGTIAAPSSPTDFSGKTVLTIANSIAPIISGRFLTFNSGWNGVNEEAVIYVDSGNKNIRFTGDTRNTAITTAHNFTLYWIIA